MIPTRTAEVFLKDGVVIAAIRPGVTQSLADAQDNLKAIETLAGPVRHPLMIDMRNALPLTVEARHFYAAQKMSDTFTAMALLVHGSPLGQMLGNVYFRMARHKVQLRMFTDENKALAWLKSKEK